METIHCFGCCAPRWHFSSPSILVTPWGPFPHGQSILHSFSFDQVRGRSPETSKTNLPKPSSKTRCCSIPLGKDGITGKSAPRLLDLDRMLIFNLGISLSWRQHAWYSTATMHLCLTPVRTRSTGWHTSTLQRETLSASSTLPTTSVQLLPDSSSVVLS